MDSSPTGRAIACASPSGPTAGRPPGFKLGLGLSVAAGPLPEELLMNDAMRRLEGLVGEWDVTMTHAWFLDSLDTEIKGSATFDGWPTRSS